MKSLDAVAAVRVEFRAPQDVMLPQLGIWIRFACIITGEANVAHTLYELLCSNSVQVLVRDPTPNSRVRPVTLRGDRVRPAGIRRRGVDAAVPATQFSRISVTSGIFHVPRQVFLPGR